MTSRDPVLFVEDMILYARKIEGFCRGLSEQSFIEDDRTHLAVIRCFEVIGEAAKSMPIEIRQRFPVLPWRQMISFRNFLIHEYVGITLATVFKTAQEDLPVLLQQLELMKQSLEAEG